MISQLQESIPCRCCGNESELFEQAQILGRLSGYYECGQCKYVQTSSPDWLDDAYAKSINASDTGIMVRNRSNCEAVAVTMGYLGLSNNTVVDHAGGHGVLVRMLRDLGIDAYWEDKFSENLFARGFESPYKQIGPEQSSGKRINQEQAGLISAFEVFEHWVEPLEELSRLCEIGPNILCSTTLIPSPSPAPSNWWYYGLEHGQHIGFYRYETLQFMAKKLGKHVVSNKKDFHLFTDKPVSKILWRTLLKVRRLLIIPISLRRKSLTWSDHLFLANK